MKAEDRAMVAAVCDGHPVRKVPTGKRAVRKPWPTHAKARVPDDSLGRRAEKELVEWRAALSKRDRNRLYSGNGPKFMKRKRPRKKTAPGRTSRGGCH